MGLLDADKILAETAKLKEENEGLRTLLALETKAKEISFSLYEIVIEREKKNARKD